MKKEDVMKCNNHVMVINGAGDASLNRVIPVECNDISFSERRKIFSEELYNKYIK